LIDVNLTVISVVAFDQTSPINQVEIGDIAELSFDHEWHGSALFLKSMSFRKKSTSQVFVLIIFTLVFLLWQALHAPDKFLPSVETNRAQLPAPSRFDSYISTMMTTCTTEA
jgi:hypothetical protein